MPSWFAVHLVIYNFSGWGWLSGS